MGSLVTSLNAFEQLQDRQVVKEKESALLTLLFLLYMGCCYVC